MQTDGHDEANKHFGDYANAFKNVQMYFQKTYKLSLRFVITNCSKNTRKNKAVPVQTMNGHGKVKL
jgi:hypothetical protein